MNLRETRDRKLEPVKGIGKSSELGLEKREILLLPVLARLETLARIMRELED